MIMEENIVINMALISSVIVGLSQIVKGIFGDKMTKYIPVINIILGIVGGIVYLYPSDIKIAILAGIICGQNAGGNYSELRNMMKGKSDKNEKKGELL